MINIPLSYSRVTGHEQLTREIDVEVSAPTVIRNFVEEINAPPWRCLSGSRDFSERD